MLQVLCSKDTGSHGEHQGEQPSKFKMSRTFSSAESKPQKGEL